MKKTNNENQTGKTGKKPNGSGKPNQVNTRRSNSLQGPIAVRKQKVQLEPAEPTGKNIIVVDTNVLIDDPSSIIELRKGGNLLVIPFTVLLELDKLKKTPGIKYEVMDAIREIDKLKEANDASLIIERRMNFSRMNLDKNNPDHQIIATLNEVLSQFAGNHEPYKGYDRVKMVTGDYTVKILARETNQKVKPIVESYKKGLTVVNKKKLVVPILKVSASIISEDRKSFPAKGRLKDVVNNSIIIGYTDNENVKKGEFVAIKKGNFFEIFDNNISAYGITAKHNGSKNWEQIAALHFLLNPDVPCVILQGGAGTGKTLLSLAAALEQQHKTQYYQTIISRPIVPLDPEQQLGFLPGDIAQKMNPWLLPIYQNLNVILRERNTREKNMDDLATHFGGNKKGRQGKEEKEEKKELNINKSASIAEVLDENGIAIQPLDSIRGATFSNSYIVIEEAQNLTVHQARTIATRVGQKTKIIFNGDLSQIDNRHLNKNNSGLTYLMHKFAGSHMVGIVNFKETLRSEFASFAEKVL
jgi:PhoH-like ATPase